MGEFVSSPQKPRPASSGVERVLYGVGKFVENQMPMAHSDRILSAINRHVIPKLNPEQMMWVRKHKDAIETASVVAGVGITATEITIATVLTVKAARQFKRLYERIQASRPPRAPRQEGGRSALQEVANGRKRRKGPDIIYDRTEEMLLLQEMAQDPKWQGIPGVRDIQDNTIRLRDNETVDWKRLGLISPEDQKKLRRKAKAQKTYPLIPEKPDFVPEVGRVATQTTQRSGIAQAIRDKLNDVLPWSLKNQELALRRKKIAGQKARDLKKATEIARKKQQTIWDAERLRMQQRQVMNMEADHQQRLQAAIERGNAERHRLEAIQAVVDRGAVIDRSLARKNPQLVALLAEKMQSLPTNETSATREIARLLVQIGEKPDAYQSFLARIADAPQDIDALRAAAQVLERAYNSQKGVRKIDGAYTAKFTTLASVWLHRLGKVGLDLLLGK